MKKSFEATKTELMLGSLLLKEDSLSAYRNRESRLIATILEAFDELPEVRKVQDELVQEINALSIELGIKLKATKCDLKLFLDLRPDVECATKPYKARTNNLERMVAPTRPTTHLKLSAK